MALLMKIYVVANKPYITSIHARKLFFELHKATEMCEFINKHCDPIYEPGEWKVYEAKVRIKK